MPGAPPSIASIADVRRLSALPYERFMPHRRILEALQDVAARQPQRIALTGIELPDPDAAVRRWTYAQLVADVRRTANLFHALADGAPARVALLLPPMPQTHLALWAAETAGTACPINHQLLYRLTDALRRAPAGTRSWIQSTRSAESEVARPRYVPSAASTSRTRSKSSKFVRWL